MADLCPSCGGPRLPNDPCGLRVQHVVSCPVVAAEDATQAADKARGVDFRRAVTPTERLLLAAWGHDLPAEADRASTHVRWITRGARRRDFVVDRHTTIHLDPEETS
jgi:hypothetical protein